MTATAHFISQRAELLVVERPAVPQWEGGRQISTAAGKYHQFKEHRCTVEGQKSIDYLRLLANGPSSPGLWELDGASDVPASVDLLRELAIADIARVREILAAERDSANRPEVVETCEAIIERAGVSDRAPGGQARKPRHEVVTG